jgi:hypothetical protein
MDCLGTNPSSRALALSRDPALLRQRSEKLPGSLALSSHTSALLQGTAAAAALIVVRPVPSGEFTTLSLVDLIHQRAWFSTEILRLDGQERRLALKSYCLAGRGPGLRSWLLGLQTQSSQALRSVSLVFARHNDQRKYVFLTDEARRMGVINYPAEDSTFP